MAKPGRKLDRKQTNRRQKHELDYRAKLWRCSKLAVILADMLENGSPFGKGMMTGGITAEQFIESARRELRRANRAARKAGKP